MPHNSDKSSPAIVVIGGGTGSFTLLQGLKRYTNNLTALVNMADDGGSTGILRDELGVLPPGDVRQCLVALSESPKVRDLFNYRFTESNLKGHSFGNLFISTVEKMTSSFSDAVELASEVLRIRGRVLPITTDNVQLIATLPDGQVAAGEYKISQTSLDNNLRPRLTLNPPAEIYPPAREAILSAELVVIAPGNLYGSLAPALIVNGVRAALELTAAKIVYVCNLVTKPHQTDGFTVQDYAAEIERFIGAPVLDYVIYNTTRPPENLLAKYVHDGEYLIEFDSGTGVGGHYRAIGLALIAKSPVKPAANDAIGHARSLIRHDSEAAARAILELTT